MNDRFRRLTDEEIASLRKEMQEAGEWAKEQLQLGGKPAEPRQAILANQKPTASRTNDDGHSSLSPAAVNEVPDRG